jgi:hypothetical protein
MIRASRAGQAGECSRCGDLIPPHDADASDSGRCLRCTIGGLMRERRGVCPAAEPPPLHRMGRTA